VSYKRKELLAICGRLGSPTVFGGVGVAHLISFLCCVFVLFVVVLCRLYLMLPVPLDSPFLIAPSVLANVYLQRVSGFDRLLRIFSYLHHVM